MVTPLREKCPNTELFLVRSISPYSVPMQENTDQKKLRILTLFTQTPRTACFFIIPQETWGRFRHSIQSYFQKKITAIIISLKIRLSRTKCSKIQPEVLILKFSLEKGL